jgi:hypothetical protein
MPKFTSQCNGSINHPGEAIALSLVPSGHMCLTFNSMHTTLLFFMFVVVWVPFQWFLIISFPFNDENTRIYKATFYT